LPPHRSSLGPTSPPSPASLPPKRVARGSCAREDGGGSFFFSRKVEVQASSSDGGGGSFGLVGRIHFSPGQICEGRPYPVGWSLISAISASAWAAAVELEPRNPHRWQHRDRAGGVEVGPSGGRRRLAHWHRGRADGVPVPCLRALDAAAQ